MFDEEDLLIIQAGFRAHVAGMPLDPEEYYLWQDGWREASGAEAYLLGIPLSDLTHPSAADGWHYQQAITEEYRQGWQDCLDGRAQPDQKRDDPDYILDFMLGDRVEISLMEEFPAMSDLFVWRRFPYYAWHRGWRAHMAGHPDDNRRPAIWRRGWQDASDLMSGYQQRLVGQAEIESIERYALRFDRYSENEGKAKRKKKVNRRAIAEVMLWYLDYWNALHWDVDSAAYRMARHSRGWFTRAQCRKALSTKAGREQMMSALQPELVRRQYPIQADPG